MDPIQSGSLGEDGARGMRVRRVLKKPEHVLSKKVFQSLVSEDIIFGGGELSEKPCFFVTDPVLPAPNVQLKI